MTCCGSAFRNKSVWKALGSQQDSAMSCTMEDLKLQLQRNITVQRFTTKRDTARSFLKNQSSPLFFFMANWTQHSLITREPP